MTLAPPKLPRPADGLTNTERGVERKRPRLVEDSAEAVTMEHTQLSCPYRQRDRSRFNIRDHPRCAREFRSMSELKSVTR
jgi:hypothetical protein